MIYRYLCHSETASAVGGICCRSQRLRGRQGADSSLRFGM